MCHCPLRRFLDILPGFPAVKPYLSVAGLSSFSSVEPIINGRRPEAINKTPEGTRPFTVCIIRTRLWEIRHITCDK
jgi:hypothetical protein